MLTDFLPSFLQGGWNDLTVPSTWPAIAACTVPALLFTLLGWQVLCYSRSPLRRYPGPVLAGTFLSFMLRRSRLRVGRINYLLCSVR